MTAQKHLKSHWLCWFLYERTVVWFTGISAAQRARQYLLHNHTQGRRPGITSYQPGNYNKQVNIRLRQWRAVGPIWTGLVIKHQRHLSVDHRAEILSCNFNLYWTLGSVSFLAKWLHLHGAVDFIHAASQRCVEASKRHPAFKTILSETSRNSAKVSSSEPLLSVRGLLWLRNDRESLRVFGEEHGLLYEGKGL